MDTTKIRVQQLSKDELDAKGVKTWPVWEKEVSKFDWFYDTTEHCYILEGHVSVTTASETVVIKAGDFVSFPAGLSCKWNITEAVRKHYTFE